MTDFVESYMHGITEQMDLDVGIDEQRVIIKSMTGVLRLLMERELSERQHECLHLFYVEGLSQAEIAKRLHLSQPTVCRHIHNAKNTINKTLGYCYYAVKQANEQWLKYY